MRQAFTSTGGLPFDCVFDMFPMVSLSGGTLWNPQYYPLQLSHIQMTNLPFTILQPKRICSEIKPHWILSTLLLFRVNAIHLMRSNVICSESWRNTDTNSFAVISNNLSFSESITQNYYIKWTVLGRPQTHLGASEWLLDGWRRNLWRETGEIDWKFCRKLFHTSVFWMKSWKLRPMSEKNLSRRP